MLIEHFNNDNTDVLTISVCNPRIFDITPECEPQRFQHNRIVYSV
jgi:hypothetical protein